MSDSDERRKILDMLASGQITADQAASLLEAIGGQRTAQASSPARKGIARLVRINVDATNADGSKDATVRVNVPLALAKFASRFVPQDARNELKMQGVDLSEVLDALGDDVPDGRLVDIDATEEDSGKTVHVIVEVV